VGFLGGVTKLSRCASFLGAAFTGGDETTEGNAADTADVNVHVEM
jgi:hypothetical protein